jgi:hypothetical protein
MKASSLGRVLFAVATVAILAGAVPAFAQPYNAWLTIGSPTSPGGFVAVPPSGDFNFTTGFTFEAWVSVKDNNGIAGTSCSSIAGKNWTAAWWIGVCGTTMRSYIKGTDSLYDAGTIPANTWTHIAVTYDGTTRRHYIDGELVGSHPDAPPMTSSATEMRIGSDTNYAFSPLGAIDEVRFWNVARTQAQLRSTINQTINGPTTGLVAVYHLDGNANDVISSSHNGVLGGSVGGYLNAPVTTAPCSTTSTVLCVSSNRFEVSTRYYVDAATNGNGKVVTALTTPDSGLFWFFGADNWEVLVKVLNGCGVNSKKWVFAAASTTVHYQLIVVDRFSGQTKRYFNYNGESAPAVTDTGAFDTCP